DLTDRNRTSPFAFTGNKFEFRMVPSSMSIANPNIILNTAVADILSEFADELEKSTNINADMQELIAKVYRAHKRVIYNGNNYSGEWVEEATKRGLANITNTVDALMELAKDYSIELFDRHDVFTRQELESRNEIQLEAYSQQINIEASIMIELTKKQVFPAAGEYIRQLSGTIEGLKASDFKGNTSFDKLLEKVAKTADILYENIETLEELLLHTQEVESSPYDQARAYRTQVFTKMADLREASDTLETLIPCDLWPIPTYLDLLFRL
ncbi:MAG: glutamine synthetase type III, partial [Spirochaetales bacterium]|nr:glutamine synthetase type III [Spirochaetales bacterium]